MDRADIIELHYITHIDNVSSIMKMGILSKNMITQNRINCCDISEEGVQDRRLGKKIPGTRNELHDYVNLYFDAHNPMLSARRSKNKEICVLRVDKTIIDFEGIIVTDKNAARDCWFKSVSEGLPLLESKEIFAEYWLNDDPFEEDRLKGVKCSEVLVPKSVAANYIIGAYVANDKAFEKFKNSSVLSVEIKSRLFF